MHYPNAGWVRLAHETLSPTGQVVEMLAGYGDQLTLVNVAGENRKVNIGMLPEETFDAGDWVIIHMGFVVEKTDKAGADAAMAGLEVMGRGSETGEDPGQDPRAFP
ncbi:MAG TPA: HypC/HybG/HupF family hydrogenase formation chaperone [Mycobacterium sp.]